MKRRFIAGAALAIAVLAGAFLLTSGCKKEASGVVELAFWGGWTGADQESMMKIVDDFNSKNKGGIHVTLTLYQWDSMFNKFVTSVRGGNPPDVVAMHQSDVPQYAAMGALSPMDDLITTAGLKQADFDAAAWEGFKYKDKMYAMPLDMHMLGMFINVDMFKKAGLDPANPPQDRESLIAAAQKLTITDASGKVVQYGIGIPTTHPHGYRYWFGLLYQNGGSFLTPDNSAAAFNTPQGAEAYQFLNDLAFKYNVAPQNEENVDNDFKAGRIAILLEGPWMIPSAKKQQGLNFETARFPQIFAKRGVWANGHGLCIPASRNPDKARAAAALKLLRFISDNSLVWAGGGQIPMRKSVLESKEFLALPYMKPFIDSIPDAVFLPKLEKGSMIFAANAGTPMMTAMQEVLLNKKPAADALNEAAIAVNGILQQK